VPPLSPRRPAQGRYWQVGDVRNTPGRSMFVRPGPTAKGPAGKWTDAATGEHGDLLDVIRESCGLIDFADVADEARTFLSLPRPNRCRHEEASGARPHGSPEAARRLFAMSQPITRHARTVVSYANAALRICTEPEICASIALLLSARRAFPTETWPAMIAAVTDPGARSPARIGPGSTHDGPTRRRSTTQACDGRSSRQRGSFRHGGESWRPAKASRPSCRRVKSAHADGGGALRSPSRRHPVPGHAAPALYLRDDDPAGDGARDSLVERANAAGIEAIVLASAATSTRISAPSASMRSAPDPDADRAAGRRRLHGSGGIAGSKEGGGVIMPAGCVNHRRGPRLGLREGDRPTVGPARNGGGRLFSAAVRAAFHREAK
jgi:hypothetical protein